jgi:polyisoprenoid-binding protein YceI
VASSKYPEIEENARETIGAKKHATIQFVSTEVTETAIAGRLTLNGQTHEVRGLRSGNSAEFRFDQRTFGIKPYSAMLGALKVKPEVKVTVKLKV